jgi:putative ubiquitin-RnfH superfamily antitoxin RatB of RatAB toxin-antitoxin module
MTPITMMHVTLVRAWPGRFDEVGVELAAGACVGDALAAAGWALDGEFVALAVFGQAAEPGTPLHAGDRVELLRALQLDPKQARRLRAEGAKRGG